MKLFDFLEIINKEEFPFRLEYESWSGNIKVIVDTFNGFEEYCFDEVGIIQFTEFQEKRNTEEIMEIKSKINEL